MSVFFFGGVLFRIPRDEATQQQISDISHYCSPTLVVIFLKKRHPLLLFWEDAFTPTKQKHTFSSQQDDHRADARHLLSGELLNGRTKTRVQWKKFNKQEQ